MARAKGIKCEAVWDGQTLVVKRGAAVLYSQSAASLPEAIDWLTYWRLDREIEGWRTRGFAQAEEAHYGRWNIWLYRR